MLLQTPWSSRLLLLLFLMPLAGKGQDYILRHRVFSIEEGLSSRFVRKVIQDRRGFIWISTSEGLNRYDGEKVLHYTKEQHGLPSNDINLLFEGPNGLLWLGTWIPKAHKGVMGGGLKVSLFNPDTEQVKTFQEHFGNKAPFDQEELFGLYIDGNRQAWLGTYSGKAYHYDGHRFKLLVDNHGAFPVSYALPATERTFWMLGPNALLRIDSTGGIVEQDTLTGYAAIPYEITLLQNGGLQVQGFWHHKIKYLGQELSQQYRLPTGETLDVSSYAMIREGPKGRLWCFRENALEVFDTAGQRVTALSESLEDSTRYSFKAVSANLFVDENGLAWVVPHRDLLLLDIRENAFRSYLSEGGFSLRSMIQLSQDRVAVNTYAGLYLLNLSTGEATPLMEEEKLLGMGVVRGADGNLWVAAHGASVARIDIDSNSIQLYSVRNSTGNPFDPLCPFFDKSGKLWMGTVGGLAAFDSASGQFVFEEYLNRPEHLGDKAVNWFCENEEGIWIGSSEGLFLLSSDGSQIRKIAELPPFYIFHIYPESDNRFWMSTRGGGLVRWDRAEKSIRQFNAKDGLSSNIIYSAYPDNSGFLWLPSQNGLMRFDTATYTVRVFKDIHGLPSNEFNHYAHLQLDDGRLLFGTINGLASFSPEEIPGRQRGNTQLNILEAEQFDSGSGTMEVITGQVKKQGALELTSRRRFAVLKFFLNDFFQPESNRYFYKIEGLASQWQMMKENQVPIGQMPYGKYRLKVRAIGQDGYWAGNELAIPIHSIRPLYLRWWFILLMGFMVTGVVMILFRWRLWQLRASKAFLEAEVARRTQQIERDRRIIAEQKAHLEEMNAAKDKLFSIVGHELRGPLMYFGNIANRISYALQRKEYEHLEGLGEKVKTIASSTNNMLNNLLNWSLLQGGRLSFGKGPSDVQAVLHPVMDTYREVAKLKQLRVRLDIMPGFWVQAGADGLSILLQNLLSNAIKYTPEGGAISVRVSRKGKQVAIAVQDEGIGMSKEKTAQLFSAPFQPALPGTAGERGTGLGLQIVQEILRRCNGELEVESQEGEGSTFTILLPLANSE